MEPFRLGTGTIHRFLPHAGQTVSFNLSSCSSFLEKRDAGSRIHLLKSQRTYSRMQEVARQLCEDNDLSISKTVSDVSRLFQTAVRSFDGLLYCLWLSALLQALLHDRW